MSAHLLEWFYLIVFVLLLGHEIVAAYWREWDLLKWAGGPATYLGVRVAFFGLALFGLTQIVRQFDAGLIFACALGVAGLIVFGLHISLPRPGGQKFASPLAAALLLALLVSSLVLLALSLSLMLG